MFFFLYRDVVMFIEFNLLFVDDLLSVVDVWIFGSFVEK